MFAAEISFVKPGQKEERGCSVGVPSTEGSNDEPFSSFDVHLWTGPNSKAGEEKDSMVC